MRREIMGIEVREPTPEEIEFYMARGRQLRAEAFANAGTWIAARLRAGLARLGGMPAAERRLHFGPRLKGTVPHVD